MVYPIQFHKVIEVLNLDEETKKLPRLLMVEQYYLFSKEVKPSTALEEVLEVKERATNNSSVTQQIYGLLTLLNDDIFKRECRIKWSYLICFAVSGMYKDAVLEEAIRKVFTNFRFESCLVEVILFDVPQMKSFEFCIRPQFLWIQTANFVILPLDLISAKKEDDTSLVKFVDEVNFIKSLSSMSMIQQEIEFDESFWVHGGTADKHSGR
ncbi:hypothetical protein Q3G72_013198 [Acer saccharum]|nr:hypothetical protein Q3G72_013198 [Acer saccharum]